MVAPLPPDQARLAAIREALPAVGAGIYLNTASAGPLPSETVRLMAELAAAEATLGRGHPDDPAETDARIGEARAALAAVLASDLEAVGLAAGQAGATHLALAATGLRSGDRVIVLREQTSAGSAAGEPASLPVDPWLDGSLAAFGIQPIPVPFEAGDDDSALIGSLASAVAGGAGLVVLPHVADGSGRRLPVEQLAAVARAHESAVLVDGGQSVGAIRLAADQLGADFLVFPSERWLLGPAGLAGIWCGPRFIERARTLHPSGFAGPGDAPAAGLSGGGWHRPSVAGFARSCGWLAMHLGLEWTWDRAAALAREAVLRLGGIPGVGVLTPVDRMATIVTFTIAGWTAGAALDELGARDFVIAGSVPGRDAIRISPGSWNSEAELERFGEGVALLAAHTPATIPPRRTLNVLS